jgi:uncharacterized protein (TIGR00375 family)
MQIIADLHAHSRFSRATSQKMNLEEMESWAIKKGIGLLATTDWLHGIWFKEIVSQLEEVEKGIYQIKNSRFPKEKRVRFLFSTEISCIYSQGNAVRKIHSLIFSPSIQASEKLYKELLKRGCKLMSDGRPIVGISTVDLLKIALDIDKNFLLIPAHAWTPWFGIFGSKSGFDSLYECFGEMEKYVYAIETGLSSDPIMNWQIQELENRSILSFSDAHSGPKMGREATVFMSKTNSKFEIRNSKFSYQDIISAIKQDNKGKLKIAYTIEFFPEEGKYHWSGHRNCNVKYSPQDIKEKGINCPVCGNRLVIGVENRVVALAKKEIKKNDLIFKKNPAGMTFVFYKDSKRKPFISVIPLYEVLLELNEGSPTRALTMYENLTSGFASEFDILIKQSYDSIRSFAGSDLEKAIKIIRERQVYVDPGYDGVFGKVKIFKNNENQETKEAQPGLF